MKGKKRHFMILIAMVSTNLFGAVLPENSVTVADVSKFREDISLRIKAVPVDETEIILERNWLANEIGSVRKLIGDNSNSVNPDFESFENGLISSTKIIENINCTDLNSSLQELKKINRRHSRSPNIKIINPFEEPKGWSEISDAFSDIDSFFQSPFRSQAEPLTTTSCESLKVRFNGIGDKINQLMINIKNEYKSNDDDRKAIVVSLNLLLEDLNTYNKSLSDELRKASTKNTLGSNLHLMILVIGVLSIGAIALVRWFPIEVMTEWVESGQVIQFVTVMIILSVIMALGLAGLLSENTLGTLLGGIGGYVLSQGVGRSAARRAIREHEKNEKL